MRDLVRLLLVAVLSFAIVGAAMIYTRNSDVGTQVAGIPGRLSEAVTEIVDKVAPVESAAGIDSIVTSSSEPSATILKVLRPLQGRWMGLAGFPDETQIRFAIPPGIAFTGGTLDLSFDSELAEHGDGRMTLAVNGRDRAQVILNSGRQRHDLKIALDPSDLLGAEVELVLTGRGNTNSGQICPTDAANSGSAVTLRQESALNLVTAAPIEDPETRLIAAADPVRLMHGAVGSDAAGTIWAAQHLKRSGIASELAAPDLFGTQVRVTTTGTAPVAFSADNGFQLAGQDGVERLVALRTSALPAPATEWPVSAASLGGETIVKNFRGTKRWTLNYKLADLPKGLAPGRLDLKVAMSELAEGNDWVLRASLNNNLIESRRIGGKAKSIDLSLDLPYDQQGLSNTIQIELVDTSPNQSICRAGPDAQAQLLPTTSLALEPMQPIGGWFAMVRDLAAAPSVDLSVEGSLDVAEATRAAAMLEQFLPSGAVMAFGDQSAPMSLTLVSGQKLSDAMRNISMLAPTGTTAAGAGKLLILPATSGSRDPITIHDLSQTDLGALLEGMKRNDVGILVQRQ